VAEDGAQRSRLETELIQVDPREVRLLEVNARYMDPQTYQRLVENVRHDGCLTSVPLCYRTEGGELRCISGNHRTKAAVDAGLEQIAVMVIKTPISNDEFIAKQLSHNALAGKDNEEILALLWREMEDPEMKLYSGLDKAMVEGFEPPKVPPLDAGLDFEQVTLFFVGEESQYVQKVAQEVLRRGILAKEVWVESIGAYDKVVETMKAICDQEGIHNFATAIGLMAQYAEKYMASLETVGATE